MINKNFLDLRLDMIYNTNSNEKEIKVWLNDGSFRTIFANQLDKSILDNFVAMWVGSEEQAEDIRQLLMSYYILTSKDDKSPTKLYGAVKSIVYYNASKIYAEWQKNNNLKIAPMVPKLDKDGLASFAYCYIVQQIILEQFNVVVPVAKDMVQINLPTEFFKKAYGAKAKIETSIGADEMHNYFFLPFDIAANRYVAIMAEHIDFRRLGISLHNHTEVCHKPNNDHDFCADSLRNLNNNINNINSRRCRTGSAQYLLFFKQEMINAMQRLNYSYDEIIAMADIIYQGDGFCSSSWAKKDEKEFFGDVINYDYEVKNYITDISKHKQNTDFFYEPKPQYQNEIVYVNDDNKIEINTDYRLTEATQKLLNSFMAFDKTFRQIETIEEIRIEQVDDIITQKQLDDAIAKLCGKDDFILSSVLMFDRSKSNSQQQVYKLVINKI